MTTFDVAVENAARMLRIREEKVRVTFGSVGNEAMELAAAWTELAHVLKPREGKADHE